MPALIRSVGASSRGRLLDERLHPAVVVGGHHAERRRVVDLGQGDGALGPGPVPVVEGHQGAEVEVGEDVAVDDDEALVDAGLGGGEADGAGGVERLGLDGVVEADAGAHAVGVARRGRRRAGSRATAPPRRRRAPSRWASTRSIIGHARRPAASAWASSRVSGRSRVPKPPTRTTALTGVTERAVVGGARPAAVVVVVPPSAGGAVVVAVAPARWSRWTGPARPRWAAPAGPPRPRWGRSGARRWAASGGRCPRGRRRWSGSAVLAELEAGHVLGDDLRRLVVGGRPRPPPGRCRARRRTRRRPRRRCRRRAARGGRPRGPGRPPRRSTERWRCRPWPGSRTGGCG